jgi:pyrroline-5-carboxylate reductase
MKTSIGFIGGGRITRIFLQGFRNKSELFESVKVFEPNAETLGALTEDFPDIEKAETAELAAIQQLVFIAVHPPVVMETLQKIKNAVIESTVVISLAPKITLEKMASVLPTKKLVRMIPNATSFINEGFNPVSFYPGLEEKEKKALFKLLKILGKTIVTEEAKLESYAIVSAMLPTYFWFQWHELERIGKKTGLTSKEARKAVKSTLKKALNLYYNSELTSAEVMDLIPVKPIGDNENEIRDIFDTKLMGLFAKIKP